MSIKTRFSLLYVILTALMLAIAFCIYLIDVYGETRYRAEINRAESLKLASHLSISSDDLTTMVRNYVITGEKRFEEYFYRILNIREGEALRPSDYDEMYWDYMTALHDEFAEEKGEKASLIFLLKQHGVTKKEMSILKLAYERSNMLAEIEIEALNAMKGVFKDALGEYSVFKEPDQNYAISLLYSDNYHYMKAQIMEPIGDFYDHIDMRTALSLAESREKQIYYRHLAFNLIVVAASFFLFAMFNVRQNIVKPILELSNVAERIKDGNSDDRVNVKSSDEIGRLARSFNEMNDNLGNVISKLKDLSYIDSLTQIANRHTFDQTFVTELRRHQREQKNFTLMLIDIDFFKRLNDSAGHQIGDQCLVEVADILSNHFKRAADFVARYGGEEFAAILPNTNIHESPELAEGVCRAIENAEIPHPDSPISQCITISVGVVSLTPSRKDSTDKLFKLADKALYQAKSEGRNRVVIAAL